MMHVFNSSLHSSETEQFWPHALNLDESYIHYWIYCALFFFHLNNVQYSFEFLSKRVSNLALQKSNSTVTNYTFTRHIQTAGAGVAAAGSVTGVGAVGVGSFVMGATICGAIAGCGVTLDGGA